MHVTFALLFICTLKCFTALTLQICTSAMFQERYVHAETEHYYLIFFTVPRAPMSPPPVVYAYGCYTSTVTFESGFLYVILCRLHSLRTQMCNFSICENFQKLLLVL